MSLNCEYKCGLDYLYKVKRHNTVVYNSVKDDGI